VNPHITAHRDGFGPGHTPVTRCDDPDNGSGIGLAVLKLARGQSW
jgi:hypothetical protein